MSVENKHNESDGELLARLIELVQRLREKDPEAAEQYVREFDGLVRAQGGRDFV